MGRQAKLKQKRKEWKLSRPPIPELEHLKNKLSSVELIRWLIYQWSSVVDLAKPREAQHSGAAECLDESWAGSSLAYFDSRYNFLIQIL
ncbi:hypothetical protein NIES4102_43210 (plasmid) [Chondrocystis sp. NIES-4102]|nr:hypothetical protein NIES4102_43210 [Chondrocystis sp. NIES-4102]